MGRERGSGVTPERVVGLLKKEVSETSLLAVSRSTGLGLAAIGRYLKGIGEPTTATLLKLANHFGTTVSYLRGEAWTTETGGVISNMVELSESGPVRGSCSRCGGEVTLSLERGKTGDSPLVAVVHPCKTCCKG